MNSLIPKLKGRVAYVEMKKNIPRNSGCQRQP